MFKTAIWPRPDVERYIRDKLGNLSFLTIMYLNLNSNQLEEKNSSDILFNIINTSILYKKKKIT